jgi:hypothetical protein
MEVLEKDVMNTDHRVMYMRIQHREYLNAYRMLPVGHPELVAATEETASMLFEYLRGSYLSPDEALTKILENQKCER